MPMLETLQCGMRYENTFISWIVYFSSCFVNRYSHSLSTARDFGIRKGLYGGGGMGLVYLVLLLTYALAFWYGGKLTIDEPENYTIGIMLTVS
jgi:hypothetical protein